MASHSGALESPTRHAIYSSKTKILKWSYNPDKQTKFKFLLHFPHLQVTCSCASVVIWYRLHLFPSLCLMLPQLSFQAGSTLCQVIPSEHQNMKHFQNDRKHACHRAHKQQQQVIPKTLKRVYLKKITDRDQLYPWSLIIAALSPSMLMPSSSAQSSQILTKLFVSQKKNCVSPMRDSKEHKQHFKTSDTISLSI
jgi:hypothetical protein